MTQATANSVATAVRKHGGGQSLLNLQGIANGGRHRHQSGGVIKSLCCAAAGITALGAQATAPLAHPTTGVRRAPELSTPLRSKNCPHAQPVKGYRHTITSIKNTQISQTQRGVM